MFNPALWDSELQTILQGNYDWYMYYVIITELFHKWKMIL